MCCCWRLLAFWFLVLVSNGSKHALH
uniref:Uncharacterized protein n=1 Tax=Arundo donax TaxID=35708 RepID=A0A0A9BNP2_ARUDO